MKHKKENHILNANLGMADMRALNDLVDDFSREMAFRVETKINEGKEGWDSDSIDAETAIVNGLYETFEKLQEDPRNIRRQKKLLVDLANYAMFAWNRLS